MKYIFFQLFDTTEGHTSIHNSKREAADRVLRFHQDTCDEFEESSHEPEGCLTESGHIKLNKSLGAFLESDDETYYATDSYCDYSIYIRKVTEDCE